MLEHTRKNDMIDSSTDGNGWIGNEKPKG